MGKGKLLCKTAISVVLVTGLAAPLHGQTTIAAGTTGKYHLPISPTPKSIEKTGSGFPLNPKVGLVTETGTDHAAIEEVKTALKKAGVKQIVESTINHPKLEEPVIIWLGEFSDESELKTIKEDTGISNINVTQDQGYALVSNQGTNAKKHIVISGKDAAGTYYGAQTLRQMIIERQGNDWIPEVDIHDWPTMPIRGAIEGFYGTPWSHEDRLRQLEFYGENKMNSYIYAPKDDPYHREQWREPYPHDKINQIAELVKKAQENHVTFTFAISPGNTVTYSSDADLKALMDKAQAVWDIGVKSFAIFLDDINPDLRDPQDKAMFGSDRSPSASAQAYLLNRFNDQFIKTHPGAERLITVPTEYSEAGTSPYRERFADLVQPDIVVQWTGIGVVAPTIKTADADKIHGIFKHDLLIWDNYPVNDYDRNSLFLAPLVGRDADLTPDHGVIGLTANPMNESEASKIPLYTVADYTWNPDAYNPDRSLENSLKEFAGKPNAYEPLKRFVDANYATRLNGSQEPYSEKLKPLMTQLWTAYENNNAQAVAEPLLQEFKKLQTTPTELQQTLDNPYFLDEVDPYLKKMGLYGAAGEQAVKLALAKQANDTQAVEQLKTQLQNTMNEIANIPQKLSLGVIPSFLERALDGKNLAEGKTATASSSEVDWLTPDLAIDGNSNTRWASLYTDDQWLSVDLGQVYSINKVVLSWEAAYGKQYKIQVSQDGSHWTDVYTEQNGNGGTDEIEFPSTEARYVKMQGVQRSSSWGYSLYEMKVFNTVE